MSRSKVQSRSLRTSRAKELGRLGELLKYIAATLSEPVESIRRRVEAELAKPIGDATDDVLRQIEASFQK